MTSIAVDAIPSHFVTDDLLLISIFGGIINGTLIALILNSHATSGGTDFISMIISRKRESVSGTIFLWEMLQFFLLQDVFMV